MKLGTSFGLSTLDLAAALRDNGGGCLITSEFEPGKGERASANLSEAGLAYLVEILKADTLETLVGAIPPSVDLLLLDGAMALYPEVLALIEPHLRPGALILADNTDYCHDYLAKVRAPIRAASRCPLPRMSNCRCESAWQPNARPPRGQVFARGEITRGPEGDGYQPVGVRSANIPDVRSNNWDTCKLPPAQVVGQLPLCRVGRHRFC